MRILALDGTSSIGRPSSTMRCVPVLTSRCSVVRGPVRRCSLVSFGSSATGTDDGQPNLPGGGHAELPGGG
jgi:hypothetical protein